MLIVLSVLTFILLLIFGAKALAEEGGLYVDTEATYEGMAKSYENGYAPSVVSGRAEFVLPLKSTDTDVSSVTVTPVFSAGADAAFACESYELTARADANGVFLLRVSLPLKPLYAKGVYAVLFKARYMHSGAQKTQDLPMYIDLSDGIDPTASFDAPSP